MDTKQKNILDGVIDLHVHTSSRGITAAPSHARRCATHIIGLSTATIRFICTADWS